jgi:hypothetical protein
VGVIACVTIEGVLAHGDDLRNAQPTKWGRALYEGLALNFRTIAFTKADSEIAQWWLKREMLTGWAAVMSQEPYLAFNDWKVRQVEDFLAEGWEVGLVIDTDREVLERINELGVLTLKMSYPAIRVGWRQHENSPRPWTEIEEQYSGDRPLGG